MTSCRIALAVKIENLHEAKREAEAALKAANKKRKR